VTKISTVDMMLVDDLFQGDSAGYVLDFSNSTFARFFTHELDGDIYNDAYAKNGTSKANRLLCYLQTVDAKAAAQALRTLWPEGEMWCQELEHYHNPLAANPIPFDLLPGATHWQNSTERSFVRLFGRTLFYHR
jgi:hypothetical protein